MNAFTDPPKPPEPKPPRYGKAPPDRRKEGAQRAWDNGKQKPHQGKSVYQLKGFK